MSKDEVKSKVKQLFLEFINTKENYISDDMFTNNFFGNSLRLAPRDVLAFLYLVEKEFSFTVSSEEILAGKVNNLSNMVDIIYNNLHLKLKEEKI